ncbi:MAG: hypothetical protein ABI318_14580, partial [Chthoniobacteraceae bacterium]
MDPRDGLYVFGRMQVIEIAEARKLCAQGAADVVYLRALVIVRGCPNERGAVACRQWHRGKRDARNDADDIAAEEPRKDERVIEYAGSDVDEAFPEGIGGNADFPIHDLLVRDDVDLAGNSLDLHLRDLRLRVFGNLVILDEFEFELEQHGFRDLVRRRNDAAVKRLHRAVGFVLRDECAATREGRFPLRIGFLFHWLVTRIFGRFEDSRFVVHVLDGRR